MSNILIIKHGSLGDIVQISGAIKDIKENHIKEKVYILTTPQYANLFAKCPFLDGVLLDTRAPMWNLFYLSKLLKEINGYNFSHIYDLQNSTRTSIYRKFFFKKSKWNSTETSLERGTKKSDFDKSPVLERFKFQLNSFNIQTKNTLTPDFSWACINIDKIIKKNLIDKFILLFPFCSPKLSHKKWPYYNELIKLIRLKNPNIKIVVAPGPSEINEAQKINALSVINESKALNIMELASLIKKSSFVISNDTGPAHMAAHLGVKGLVIFGHHTTATKVSIETENFKSISVQNLNELDPLKVFNEIEKNIIN